MRLTRCLLRHRGWIRFTINVDGSFFSPWSGVMWADMHRLAERVLLTELKEMGLLQGDVSIPEHKTVPENI